MKKFIVALGVAAVALGFSSCNKDGGSAAGDNGVDSLAILMGQVQGARYQMLYDQFPDSIKAKFDRDQFIAGIKTVLDHNFKDDMAYLYGLRAGMEFIGNVGNMEEAGIKFDKKAFLANFGEYFKKDSLDNKALEDSNLALQVLMGQVQEKMMMYQNAERERQQREAEAAAAGNIKAGKEYVDNQKKADASIKTTESGVSYKVIKEGTGNKPGKMDYVKVNYTGKHIDGTEFDSSKGTPVQFSVSGVVPGFSEVLQMMAPGAKYVAYIPYDKAYGVQGQGDKIKPGETLVFEIEMVEVSPKPATMKPATK